MKTNHNQYVSTPDWFSSIKEEPVENSTISQTFIYSSGGVVGGNSISSLTIHNKTAYEETTLTLADLAITNSAVAVVSKEDDTVIAGQLVADTAWVSSLFIPLIGGSQLTINTSYDSTGVYGIAFYDIQKRYISGQTTVNSLLQTITAPTNAIYFRVCSSAVFENFYVTYQGLSKYTYKYLNDVYGNGLDPFTKLADPTFEHIDSYAFTANNISFVADYPLRLEVDSQNNVRFNINELLTDGYFVTTSIEKQDVLGIKHFKNGLGIGDFLLIPDRENNAIKLIHKNELITNDTKTEEETTEENKSFGNLYATGWISALGLSPGGDGPGSGGSKNLFELQDVSAVLNADGVPYKVTGTETDDAIGKALVWNGVNWYAEAVLNKEKADVMYVLQSVFSKIFTAYDVNGNVININNIDSPIDNISINYNFWSKGSISALGLNDKGSSATALYQLTDVLSENESVLGATIGSVLMYDGTHWYASEINVTGGVNEQEVLNIVTNAGFIQRTYLEENYLKESKIRDLFYTKEEVNDAFLLKAIFDKIFTAYNSSGQVVDFNSAAIDNISVNYNFWSTGYVSAQGISDDVVDLINFIDTDEVTITKRNGYLEVIGGGGAGVNFPLQWTGFSSGSWNGSSLATIEIPSKVSELTNDSNYLTKHQTIYKLTFSAGSFSAGSYTPNSAAKTIYVPTKTSHLTNNSDFTTNKYVNDTFVTIAGSEDVTGVHNFVNGLEIGGVSVHKASKGYLYIDGDLVVGGGITMYGTDGVNAPDVMGFLKYDTATLAINDDGELTVVGGTGGGGGAVLTVKAAGTTVNTYNGSTAVTVDINYTNLGLDSRYLLKTGNAATATTATKLGTATVGSVTSPIYLKSGSPTACTYSLEATVNDGTASTIAYYSGTNAVSAYTSTKGSATKPVYLKAGVPTECSAYAGGTAVTLNNSSKAAGTASFYAPTSGGAVNYVLIGRGTTTAPAWTAQSNLSVGSASTLTTPRNIWGQSFNGDADVSGNMTGVGTINNAIAFNYGSDNDTVFIQNKAGHKVVFGGSGYANQSYYFRPMYGTSGATVANLFIQNASASSTFTTTHSFNSNGDATHTGVMSANSLLVNGIAIKKATNGYLYIDGDLVVNGGITMYGTDGVEAPDVMSFLNLDTDTLDIVGGKLTVVGGTGSASSWDELSGIPTYLGTSGLTYSLTIQANGTSLGTYNGSAAKTININYSNLGLDSRYLKLTGGTISGSLALQFDVDTSRVKGYTFKNTSGANVAAVSYWNTEQEIIINPCVEGNTDYYYDNVGDYNLIIGKDKLTYNTYDILTADNYNNYLPILNSSSTHATKSSVIYAPTTAGTSGYVLKSNGSGAPVWTAQSALSAGSATKATQDGDGNVISSTYLKLSGGTMTGNINLHGTPSSWITGMTKASLMYNSLEAINTNSYYPILAAKSMSGNVANIGVYQDQFGFFGYYSGRTENSYDWSLSVNTGTGKWTCSKSITAKSGFIGNLQFDTSNAATLSAVGWYRVAVSTVYTNYGPRGMVSIRRVYNNADNETYTFCISGTTYGASITQIGGKFASRFITKIRVTHYSSNTAYVDIYYNSTVANQVVVNCVGDFTPQTPTSGATVLSYTTEFATGSGMISDSYVQSKEGFLLLDTEESSAFNSSGIRFGADASYGRISFSSTGNVGIYAKASIYLRSNSSTAASSIGAVLDTSGNLLVTGGITMYSDVRKKNILSEELVSIDKIANAPSFLYTFKDDENKHIHLGSSAQYWQSINKNFVKDNDGTLSMGYGNIALTCAISISKEVVALKERIKELENEIEQLKN